MAPKDHLAIAEARSDARDSSRLQRLAVYVVVAVALCVAVWALTDGNQRDLWGGPSDQALVIAELVAAL